MNARALVLTASLALLSNCVCGGPDVENDGGLDFSSSDAGASTGDGGFADDAGRPDTDAGGITDSGMDAGGTVDGGAPGDAGEVDAGAIDSGANDAGLDGGEPDLDAGVVPDAGAALGNRCLNASECGSGFCIDGVCCESACNDRCHTCSGADAGRCLPASGGLDPHNDCPVEGGCARLGWCDGLGECALAPTSTVCASSLCAGNASTPSRHCDGAGHCGDGGMPLQCAPFVCDTSSGLCAMSCVTSGDCISGYTCVGGQCKRSSGSMCSTSNECASGFCTDGVCCTTACSGSCERCNSAGMVGSCTPVTASQDPDNECAASPTSSCGLTGSCNGARACALYPAGSICAAPSCVTPSSSHAAQTCNGLGACQPSATTQCGAFACSPASGLCLTTCTTNSNCAAGYQCVVNTGQCKLTVGQTCTVNSDCASSSCCSSACRDLTNDPLNCGQCARACDSATSTSSCVGANCQIAQCNAGHANCDANALNGCELNNATTVNTCAAPTMLSGACGNLEQLCTAACCTRPLATFQTQTGTSGAWFSAILQDCGNPAFCPNTMQHRITLVSPTGADFDLEVYSGCGTLFGSSSQTGTTPDVVNFVISGSSGNDTRPYFVRVVPVSGSSCSPWTLTFDAPL